MNFLFNISYDFIWKKPYPVYRLKGEGTHFELCCNLFVSNMLWAQEYVFDGFPVVMQSLMFRIGKLGLSQRGSADKICLICNGKVSYIPITIKEKKIF